MATVTFMASSQTFVRLAVGGNSMNATLADNEATRELAALLEKGDITIRMSDYGGFEKVGALPQSFSAADTRITTVPGDIMLYMGNQMVIFYGSNTWSYTPLGKIDGATAETIRKFLGNGDITLTLSLDPTTAVETVVPEENKEHSVYDLNGNRITNPRPTPGIYIIDGKKTRLP